MLNLTIHQFQQKLAAFAQRQVICEYDCGQKIVHVRIDDFIKHLLDEAHEHITDAVIIELRKKWGISDIAKEIICYVPSSHDFKTANILPLQLELHHHFSLIVAATKQHLAAPDLTDNDTQEKGLKKSLHSLHRTFVNTQHFITHAISGHSDTGSASASSPATPADTSGSIELREIDHIYQAMMLEINLNIFEEIKNILPPNLTKHHFSIMQAYVKHLQQPHAENFYTEMAKFNSDHESLIKAFLKESEFEFVSNNNNNTNSNNQNFSVPSGLRISALNKKLDKLRTSIAQKYYIYYFTALDKQGAALNKPMLRAIEALLPKTPADVCDKLIQNNTTGGITYVTATPHTSHAKHFSTTALRQITMSHMSPDKLLYRLESLAATDENYAKETKHTVSGNNCEMFFNDVTRKFTYIQNRISADLKNQAGKDLTPRDVIHYNLLTSYGSTAILKDRAFDDEAKTHQNWSTEVIIEGVHRKNKQDLDKAPLFLLCNLGVNGFGVGATEGKQATLHGNPNGIQSYLDFPEKSDKNPHLLQRMTNEIFSLAEMSILNLLAKKIPQNARIKQTVLNYSAATTDHYTHYLKNRKDGTLFSESVNCASYKIYIKTAKDSMKSFISTITVAEINKKLQSLSHPAAKTEYLLTLAIAKMFFNNDHLYAKNGMLIQSLLVALQDLTISGCKSANERFANVQGLAEAAYHVDFQAALSTFITTQPIGKQQDNTLTRTLYDNLATIFNKYCLYSNGGYVISLSDQGSGPKTEAEDSDALIPNTNRVVNEKVDSLEQTEAEEMQAHKMEKHHTLCEAFDAYKKENLFLQNIIANLQHYMTQVLEHAASKSIMQNPIIISSNITPASEHKAFIAAFVKSLTEFKPVLDNASHHTSPAIIYAKTLQLKTQLQAHDRDSLGDIYGTATLTGMRANINGLLKFYEEKFPHYKALSSNNNPIPAANNTSNNNISKQF